MEPIEEEKYDFDDVKDIVINTKDINEWNIVTIARDDDDLNKQFEVKEEEKQGKKSIKHKKFYSNDEIDPEELVEKSK